MGSGSETFALFEIYDLGEILSSRDPSSTLPDYEKYKILKNHFKPDINFNFPKKLLHNCNSSCKTDYLTHEFDAVHQKTLCFVFIAHYFQTSKGN